nr:MAG TPA: 4Fe-4S binding domain protein [Caudoviricetes sp.]DAU49573.1 MAG TPA: 4Fe-4S binding domain protein [Caudoviricetes sp.]
MRDAVQFEPRLFCALFCPFSATLNEVFCLTMKAEQRRGSP